jgi:dihydroorotase
MSAGIDSTVVLKGAHVIDPGQGLDGVVDVEISGGRIARVGTGSVPAAAEVIDLAGTHLSPGWIDIHVHTYGTLGFADPDAVGVYQGVTTFVDAGGPGIGVLDQFIELMSDLKTSLYAGAFIRPMGLLGLNFIEGNVRTLGEVPVTRWIDFAAQHRDMLRYIKCNAVGDYGPGTLNLTKGLAQILELPLYMHIGEFQLQNPKHLLAPEAFRIAEAGDMITHLYHGNLGQVIDGNGKVLPVVRDAERRGVIFDLGFGGYNFSWDVAEKAFAQDLVPHTISSDLQQFNVVRPAKSLANVMNAMIRLGMTLPEVIERVTVNPAKALSLTDRAGNLRPGMPADITVFRVESGNFEIGDCNGQIRKAERQIVPLRTYKGGEPFATDMGRGQDESNWFLQIAEDHVPEAAERLSDRQRDFLAALAACLSAVDWELSSAERLDIDKAIELQDIFHRIRAEQVLPLKDALRAVYACFLDRAFTMQIGLLLLRLERPFVLRRLREIAGEKTMAA